MRAFIGIGLPEPVRTSLAALQQHLAESHADVKWVAPEQLHATLKFLDEITGAQQQQIAEFLTKISQQHEAFTLTLHHLGAFPSLHDPRILWVGAEEGKAAVVSFAEAIEKECRACGLKNEERAFSAHITIGRVRSPKQRQALIQALNTHAWTPPPAWQVSTVTLYQSVLSSNGPAYSVLGEFQLGGKGQETGGVGN